MQLLITIVVDMRPLLLVLAVVLLAFACAFHQLLRVGAATNDSVWESDLGSYNTFVVRD